MCRLLLNKGADVKHSDKSGTCALLHVVRLAKPYKYPNPKHIIQPYQYRTSMLDLPNIQEGIFEIIEILLEHDKDSLYLSDNNAVTAADVLREIATSTLVSST